ncbi:MAG TPA: class I tRNA ligase family protein [Longimicrobiaceae bacterium]|nr:class I tRNA ligase family protein [Longimicrobiaceae bacterium]
MSRPADRPLLITAAHAFVGGELNLAHAAGTYIPADIYHRLAQYFGVPARFATGIDVHGRLAEREGRRRGVPPAELATESAERFGAGLAALGVEPTSFLRTDDPRLLPLLPPAFENLASAGMIARGPSTSWFCRRCDLAITKSEVEVMVGAETRPLKKHDGPDDEPDPEALRCTLCGGAEVEVRNSEQWRMTLPRTDELRSIAARQVPGVRRQLAGVLEGDFTEWEFTRERYYGLPMPLQPDTSLYLWNDSLFSKVALLGATEEEVAGSLRSARLVCFFGKNILHYYGLILPTLLRYGFGTPEPDLLFSARGFCLTARTDVPLDVREAVDRYGRDELRFCCAYAAFDDIQDFALQEERFELVRSSVLRGAFERYFHRAAGLPAGGTIREDPAADALLRTLRSHFEQGGVRRILLALEEFARGETRRPARPGGTDGGGAARRRAELALGVLSCYMPDRFRDLPLTRRRADGSPWT